jgi:excisionase family DNA binding protein
MPIGGYYTTKEAAELLALTQAGVQDAVRRGALAVARLARRTLIPAAEIERYRKEVQNTQGWARRKEPGYEPNQKQRTYQQRYYQRGKAARTQQPATPPAESE